MEAYSSDLLEAFLTVTSGSKPSSVLPQGNGSNGSRIHRILSKVEVFISEIICRVVAIGCPQKGLRIESERIARVSSLDGVTRKTIKLIRKRNKPKMKTRNRACAEMFYF